MKEKFYKRPVIRYKFLVYDEIRTIVSYHNRTYLWKKNEWKKCSSMFLSMCSYGLHASKNIFDAWNYCGRVNGVFAVVECKGACLFDDKKECFSEMRIINTRKWTEKLNDFVWTSYDNGLSKNQIHEKLVKKLRIGRK